MGVERTTAENYKHVLLQRYEELCRKRQAAIVPICGNDKNQARKRIDQSTTQ